MLNQALDSIFSVKLWMKMNKNYRTNIEIWMADRHKLWKIDNLILSIQSWFLQIIFLHTGMHVVLYSLHFTILWLRNVRGGSSKTLSPLVSTAVLVKRKIYIIAEICIYILMRFIVNKYKMCFAHFQFCLEFLHIEHGKLYFFFFAMPCGNKRIIAY